MSPGVAGQRRDRPETVTTQARLQCLLPGKPGVDQLPNATRRRQGGLCASLRAGAVACLLKEDFIRPANSAGFAHRHGDFGWILRQEV